MNAVERTVDSSLVAKTALLIAEDRYLHRRENTEDALRLAKKVFEKEDPSGIVCLLDWMVRLGRLSSQMMAMKK